MAVEITVLSAEGWAVIEHGSIRVKTVSHTRRAAIVNFLVAERRVPITAEHTDEQIDEIWQSMRQGAYLAHVTITATEAT